MSVKYTVMNPPLIKMYFHERRSNKAMIAKISVDQPKPARKPAVAPQAGRGLTIAQEERQII